MQSLATILPIAQIVLSVLLVIAILIQQSEAGIGSAFGGGSNVINPFHAKRGFEKTLFLITIILGILFIASTLVAHLI